MDILVLGDQQRADELIRRIPKIHQVKYSNNVNDASLPRYNVIFDLNFDDGAKFLQYYSYLRNRIVVVSTVKRQLADVIFDYRGEIYCKLIGMNALPGFIDRDYLELSLPNQNNLPVLQDLVKELEWDYKLVEDRVGMVTPRVLFMIINEACYTLQEGTASIEDIDQAMRLGTNYPKGPFEWADAIGVDHVYETLEALYEDTRDERYKICPMLKTKFLKRERFYR